jgi:flagellar hook assembly protein FlgD
VTIFATQTPTVTATVTPVPASDVIVVFPNPFRPDQAAGHVLKFDNCPENTQIRIFTISGELVRKYQGVSGRQTWDGKNSSGGDVVSGVYLYILDGPGNLKAIGKIFVIR